MHSYPKKKDDRRTAFRAVQKDVAEKFRRRELEMNGKKRKQALMDKLLQLKTVVEYSVTTLRKSGSKELDSRIASFFHENAVPFKVADSPSWHRHCRAPVQLTLH